jgi:hypothetical protein
MCRRNCAYMYGKIFNSPKPPYFMLLVLILKFVSVFHCIQVYERAPGPNVTVAPNIYHRITQF